MKIRAYDIIYDTDCDDDEGEVPVLPNELTFIVEDHENVEDEISDLISSYTGFCHMGFRYEVLD